MCHMSYTRVRRRCHGGRGFRLKYPKRFSVQRLRARFFYLFSRFRSSYEQTLESLKRNFSSKKGGRSGRNLVVMKEEPKLCLVEYRLRSFRRSNSFYSEAIEDCLEFIRRSSVSMDEKSVD